MQNYKIVKQDSINSLKEYISDENFLIIGDKDEKNRYEIITTLNDIVICALLYCFHGIEPQILDFYNNKMFIGINENFYCIDKNSKDLIFRIEFSSIFYEFSLIRDNKFIVIICELEIYIIDLNGNTIFKSGFGDIIFYSSVTDYYITIETELDGVLTYEVDKFID